MHKSTAKLKDVRPFSKPLVEASPDRDFQSWKSQQNKPLLIEVGCGSGFHPVLWAKQNPTQSMVAIERTKNKFLSFRQRLQNHCLGNIYPVNDDALYWLPVNIKPQQVQKYFFLYPNPYPKEKQANKRWHRNPLFEWVLETLKPHGTIEFASNESFYIDECIDYCLNFWKLTLIEKKRVTSQNKTFIKTHFEKKYLERGQTCTYLSFKK